LLLAEFQKQPHEHKNHGLGVLALLGHFLAYRMIS
jgi:hypothetical protein